MLQSIILFSFFLLAQGYLDSKIFIPITSIIDFNNIVTTTDFLNAVVYYDKEKECVDACQEAEKIYLQFAEEFEGII